MPDESGKRCSIAEEASGCTEDRAVVMFRLPAFSWGRPDRFTRHASNPTWQAALQPANTDFIAGGPRSAPFPVAGATQGISVTDAPCDRPSGVPSPRPRLPAMPAGSSADEVLGAENEFRKLVSDDS
jgi:hypothetical protein